MMDKFNVLLKSFSLDFFGKGDHKIDIEKALALKEENKAIIVDLRTKEEVDHVCFGFALNIPMSDVPERIAELPRDKMIVLFCSSCVRASIVYSYLRLNDYVNVRILVSGLNEIAAVLKPGYILKRADYKEVT